MPKTETATADVPTVDIRGRTQHDVIRDLYRLTENFGEAAYPVIASTLGALNARNEQKGKTFKG